jgi:hypothetical protein
VRELENAFEGLVALSTDGRLDLSLPIRVRDGGNAVFTPRSWRARERGRRPRSD